MRTSSRLINDITAIVEVTGINAILLCSLLFPLSSRAATYYVDAQNPHPQAPYTNWATAATVIQDAVDAATAGDLVLVTNGLYAVGGRASIPSAQSLLTNRVCLTKAITVLSVNGPAVTIIEGRGPSITPDPPTAPTNATSARCAYVGAGAVLAGFTLRNGFTFNVGTTIPANPFELCGGGVYLAGNGVVSNCVIASCESGSHAASRGAGVYMDGNGRVVACTITNNTTAEGSGGGVYGGSAADCLIAGNTTLSATSHGAGARDSTLWNCIVTNNSAGGNGGGLYGGSATNCTIVNNTLSNTGKGAGAYGSRLDRCRLARNSAPAGNGGAAGNSTLIDCVIESNTARYEGGGTWNCSVANGVVASNSAVGSGGGLHGGSATNCLIVANRSSSHGGGAFNAALWACTVTNNTAGGNGGGLSGGSATNCTIVANTISSGFGAGAHGSTLNHCRVIHNTASFGQGGGAASSTLLHCLVEGNTARISGGGGVSCTMVNCAVVNNLAASSGGGLFFGSASSCTIAGNSALWQEGGGVYEAAVVNSIVFYNFASESKTANYRGGSLMNCFTAPNPGIGNSGRDPDLASAWRLAPGSPCRGAVTNGLVTGTDLDGEAWAPAPSVGCDEPTAGAITGALAVAIAAEYTSASVGFPVDFTGNIQGQVVWSRWDFGDGVSVSNRPWITHTWSATGDYPVVLSAFNESLPTGVSATVTVHVVAAPLRYVNANNPSPQFPYDNWSKAATTIQAAIDAAGVPGGTVFVAAGTYTTGITTQQVWGINPLVSRVAITNGTTLRSSGGPLVTIIQGQGNSAVNGVRCAYVGKNARLTGFSLTKGCADGSNRSGGALCHPYGLVDDCRIYGNISAGQGGGTSWGTVSNCVIFSNVAGSGGGGTMGGSVVGCTIFSNSAAYGGGCGWSDVSDSTIFSNNATATDGGGAWSAALNRCTVTHNTAVRHGGGAYQSALTECRVEANSANRGGGLYLSASSSHDLVSDTLIVGNNASGYGGGVVGGILANCVVTANTSGTEGGGIYYEPIAREQVRNSIVYYNWAPTNANYRGTNSMRYSCTTPDPGPHVAGILTNDPQFVDAATADYRLAAASPCIDRGNNADIARLPKSYDRDGIPRPLDGDDDGIATADIGAFERVHPAADSDRDGIPDEWELRHGLLPDEAADAVNDPDGDGPDNTAEWIADTNPTNALSHFTIRSAQDTADAYAVSCLTSSNRVYTLQCRDDLQGGTWSNVLGEAQVSGIGAVTNLVDHGPLPDIRFYRLTVEIP